jgi:hypothetical protein
MNVSGTEFRYQGGLWLGAVWTKVGWVEILLAGSPTEPESKHLQAYSRFAEDLDANITQLRRKISFGFLWRPIRIAINNENRVGVQFRNRLTGNQRKLILEDLTDKNLRPVPGAAVMSHDGKVIYNMLTPHMQQFLGRCIGAIKKVGITAKGTGQFSIVLGDTQIELPLEQFYKPSDDPTIIDSVVAKAKELVGK